MKAPDRIERIDLRRRGALSVVSAVMNELRDILPDGSQRQVYAKLMDLFTAEGIHILTEHDRLEMGLSPRGPDGWTREEIAAYDGRYLAALLAPLPPVIVEYTDNPKAEAKVVPSPRL